MLTYPTQACQIPVTKTSPHVTRQIPPSLAASGVRCWVWRRTWHPHCHHYCCYPVKLP